MLQATGDCYLDVFSSAGVFVPSIEWSIKAVIGGGRRRVLYSILLNFFYVRNLRMSVIS
jgi:hypothetical protein